MATRSTTKTSRTTQSSAKPPEEAITVQRTAKCRSMGNGSQLTYEVGADTDQQPHIRMTAAAGGGFFSREWVSMKAILAALDAWPADRPLTSYALAALFRGKSANNPSFLAAVLVAEGVLRRMADRKRHPERASNALSGTAPAKPRRKSSEGGGQKTEKARGMKKAPTKKTSVATTRKPTS